MFSRVLLILHIIGALEINVANCFNVWAQWSQWSECSPRCKIGSRKRTRTCIQVPCVGSHEETEHCNSLCGCQLVPCKAGNTCIQHSPATNYTCVCQSGYAGQNSQDCNAAVGSGDKPINVQYSSSYITSPFYPNTYPVSQVTKWTVTASAGKTITLDFTDFNVGPAETPANCANAYGDSKVLLDQNGIGLPRLSADEITKFCPCILDMILIYNAVGTNINDLQAVYCNAQPPPSSITSTSSTVTIVFRSDLYNIIDNKTNKGFKISVSQTADTKNATDFNYDNTTYTYYNATSYSNDNTSNYTYYNETYYYDNTSYTYNNVTSYSYDNTSYTYYNDNDGESDGQGHDDESEGQGNGVESEGQGHHGHSGGQKHGDNSGGQGHGDHSKGQGHGDLSKGKGHGDHSKGQGHGDHSGGQRHGDHNGRQKHGYNSRGQGHNDDGGSQGHGPL